MVKVFVDGAGQSPKRPARFAVVCPALNIVQVDEHEGLTNNEAEYHAVIAALSNAKITSINESIDICSDSQLIINQLNRRWNIKEDHLRKLAEQVWLLCKDLKVRFFWVSNNMAGKVLG